MKNISRSCLFLLVLLTVVDGIDDLISARCQAKCLREYELRVRVGLEFDLMNVVSPKAFSHAYSQIVKNQSMGQI
jgi:hypothetical protein